MITRATALAASPATENLPTWNLDDLYPGGDSPELARDLKAAETEARDFAAAHQGRLADHNGADLAAAIAAYERVQERLARAGSYADLTYAADQTDPEIAKFMQGVRERINAIATHLLFFTLEINRIDDAVLARQFAAPALARWRPWIEALRAFRPHDLPDEMERLLHERAIVGAAAWSRLFDETVAGLRFEVNGKSMTSAEALHLLSDKDRPTRRAAAQAIGKTFADNIRLFALITNTLAKDKEIDDKWRKYPRSISFRNLSNRVEDPVVDALIGAVKAGYPRLAHRYYALKAKRLGLDKLEHWDRNAPLPDSDDRVITWGEARRIVLDAYGKFSPEMAKIGATFFDRRWIDAGLRPGKSPGAFAHPTVPSAHPYLLMNFQGKTRDVATLAHELGHGVHQVLAGAQGHLLSDTPLTLAETASVFGEMMTFQALLDAEQDPKRRRAMLAGKVEDMLNTVVRQIAFVEFETRVHAARREGELTPDQIGDIWLAVQGESLGPAFRFDPEYRVYWAYIPHFIHSPFYVYAYAFGDCLVNALYATYLREPQGFSDKYIAMLRAGGSKRHGELLAPFGLDAADPAFWDRGLGLIAGFIDQLAAE